MPREPKAQPHSGVSSKALKDGQFSIYGFLNFRGAELRNGKKDVPDAAVQCLSESSFTFPSAVPSH